MLNDAEGGVLEIMLRVLFRMYIFFGGGGVFGGLGGYMGLVFVSPLVPPHRLIIFLQVANMPYHTCRRG